MIRANRPDALFRYKNIGVSIANDSRESIRANRARATKSPYFSRVFCPENGFSKSIFAFC